MKKKILFFGSDKVTKFTLQSFLNCNKNNYNVEIICPPLTKPRTPLAELYEYLENQKIPIKYQFGKFKDID